VSLHAGGTGKAAELADRALRVEVPGVVVHEAKLHGHKIKPGHLAGNRFAIVVRGIARDRLHEALSALDRIAAEGLPNAFGPQRYGRSGDNATRALAWLRGGERPPRDGRLQRLLWSSLQSAMFDSVLESRVREGTWRSPLRGDLLKLRSSGGIFVCADVQTDQERAARGELSPTGPLIGARMRWPEGAPGELERRIVSATLGDGFDLARTRRLGEGSRRSLQLWVEGLRYDLVDENGGHRVACVRVYFVLPKGAYATTVLGSAFRLEEGADEGHDKPLESLENEAGEGEESEDS
jgi:tRNA pseudouridine13 synthase